MLVVLEAVVGEPVVELDVSVTSVVDLVVVVVPRGITSLSSRG